MTYPEEVTLQWAHLSSNLLGGGAALVLEVNAKSTTDAGSNTATAGRGRSADSSGEARGTREATKVETTESAKGAGSKTAKAKSRVLLRRTSVVTSLGGGEQASPEPSQVLCHISNHSYLDIKSLLPHQPGLGQGPQPTRRR